MKAKYNKTNLVLIIFFLFIIKYGKSQSFTFDIAPQQKTIYAGDTTSFDIIVTPTGGFSASINFSLELPNCIDNNISIIPSIANSPYNNIKINITNTLLTSQSTYPVIIKGSNGVTNFYDTCFVTILPDTNNFNWIIYQTINSGIQSNCVMGTAVDKNGKTWIVSRDNSANGNSGNLTMFDGTVWNLYSQTQHKIFDNCGNLISSSSGNFLPNHNLYAIVVDSLDNKWVGTYGGGILKIDSAGNWTIYNTSNSMLPGNYALSIEVDALNQVWIASLGLVKINNNVWTVYNTSNTILPSNNIRKIAFDYSGNTWFGCDADNLVKYDGTFFTIYNHSNSALPPQIYIRSLTIDNFNNVWIGTDGQGIIKFDGLNITQFTKSNSNLEDNYITGLTMWYNTVFALCCGNACNTSLSYWDGSDWINYNTTNSYFPTEIPPIMPGGVAGDLYLNHADNSLWISAEFSGLVHVIDTTYMNLPISLSNGNINYIRSEIKTYPNPITSDITIAFQKQNIKQTTFTVKNILGQIVFYQQENNLNNYFTKSIDLSFLSNGIYLLDVNVDGERTVKKIVKQ